MQPLPCHPVGAGFAGGVAVLPSQSNTHPAVVTVYDPLTDEPAAWTALPEDVATLSPPLLVTRGVLFKLFPEQQWYIGRPWETTVSLHVARSTSERADGTLQMDNNTYPWLAEFAYTATGRQWRYDLLAWPPQIHALDVIFLGRVCAALQGLLSRDETAATLAMNNLFTAPPLPFMNPPFLVADGDNIWVKFGRRIGAV